MKTIAVIASCDTKYKEVAYLRECLQAADVAVLVVDMAIGVGRSYGADITREQVVRSIGVEWNDVKQRTKGELMELITEAVKATVLSLYNQNKIDGVLAVGGVQNTTVATAAMRLLPIGFPKVMATTIACGQKQFAPVVGDKDIVVIPSISDFTGLNCITRTIMANACACVCGMVKYAGRPLQKSDMPVVGITLMGVTNAGACAAVDELERMGVEAIGFHSTGVGGQIMEQLAEKGILDGILDLTTHEITSEYFGGGFSFGAVDRMLKPLELDVPMVVCPGGLDFIDFAKSEFPPRMEQRVYNMHNGTLAHIKILPDEAVAVGKIFASRLNHAKKSVTLLLPTEGMRKNTRPGENLYCKEVDDILLRAITDNINEKVQVQWIPGNLNDESWGAQAAAVMAEELRRKGILSKSASEENAHA